MGRCLDRMCTELVKKNTAHLRENDEMKRQTYAESDFAKQEKSKLTPQEWEAVKDEAEFISATRGHDYNTAFKIAEERIRKAVGKELK